MRWLLSSILSALLLGFAVASPTANPGFAFTYTTDTQNWTQAVQDNNFQAVYVYAGDVEFYCRGSPTAVGGGGASPVTTRCVFNGSNPTAFAYYTDFAKAAAKAYKEAGKTVYINFDGRITPKVMSYVPDFDMLTSTEIQAFAHTVAAHVCGDSNVDGMGWDVEPFDNNQLEFFATLDADLTSCGKRWGVFAFGEDLNDSMWTDGLGQSGFLFDSTYDLDCSKLLLPTLGCEPCQCTPPSVYHSALTAHLTNVMSLAAKYSKPYRLMVSGSASTQLYRALTTSTCSGAGGGTAYNTSCPWTMVDWMNVALDVFDQLAVKADSRFEGVSVYAWTTTNGGGFSPTVPPYSVIHALTGNGYIPYAGSSEYNRERMAIDGRIPQGTKQRMGQERVERGRDANKKLPHGGHLHYMLGSPMNYMI